MLLKKRTLSIKLPGHKRFIFEFKAVQVPKINLKRLQRERPAKRPYDPKKVQCLWCWMIVDRSNRWQKFCSGACSDEHAAEIKRAKDAGEIPLMRIQRDDFETTYVKPRSFLGDLRDSFTKGKTKGTALVLKQTGKKYAKNDSTSIGLNPRTDP